MNLRRKAVVCCWEYITFANDGLRLTKIKKFPLASACAIFANDGLRLTKVKSFSMASVCALFVSDEKVLFNSSRLVGGIFGKSSRLANSCASEQAA